MRVVDLIVRKRDGGRLEAGEIEFLVKGVTDGSIPDYQVAAMLMAIVLRGMTPEETGQLTSAMIRSGERVDLTDVPGVKVDKHSTGGVGDKTSLIVAPLAAACGVRVPMMAGRGLGHTGGTLDKLEAIPGFRVRLTVAELRDALVRVGCGIVGQTDQIAPADRRLYSLRDVTGTVESLPLIAASIMSKKLAEGIDALVLDVKVGKGAFMKSVGDAQALAEALVGIGDAAGVRTEALLTAMDAPLGEAVGNALEVIEAVETLKGRGPQDVEQLSVSLTARMVRLAGIEPTPEAAEAKVRTALASGAGVAKLGEVIANQGGDLRVLDDYQRLPRAAYRHLITAPRSGYLAALDAGRIGRASAVLGAGRDRHEDVIDHGVGLTVLASPGAALKTGDPLVELHFNDRRHLELAAALVVEAIEIADVPPERRALVLGAVESPGRG